MTHPAIPPAGFAHYLRDAVFGAGDGIITTFAVIAGASGADLGATAAIVLSLANLVADGVSMGAGNYLALKSQLEQGRLSIADEKPHRHGLATFAAFALAGAVPLLAYLVPALGVLAVAAVLSGVTLFVVGSLRSRFVARPWWRSGLEMLLVGGAAGACAYGVGALAGWAL